MEPVPLFVLYFAGFAFIHSILAADYIKNKVRITLGEGFRFYRLVYSLLSVLTFAPAFYIWIRYSASTPPVYSIPQWLYPVIVLIRLAGAGLFTYAVFQTDLLDFVGIRQKKANVLITKGAYALVRHPLYMGGIMVLITKMVMTLLDITAVLLVSVYLIAGAFIEERRLLRLFGKEYEKYSDEVSMFIPVKYVANIMSRKR
ncbi:MAG: isoprenylcysteine carboxylmethyltransferase family protein [Candidatus Methanoperedenaceae archaeon]|nr:isoprenylcysteine carboxylmethyltransferase family protein [Candidatus Methanoperedenaceae archaeon]MDW7728190.1 isoprenylcysteine carboxylmethyltransferase family protein [Candidatus Methanoperedens sp.]